MDIRKTILSNGLALWTAQYPGEDVSIDLWIPFGQTDATPEAHLLEHMAFKSNQHRTAEQIAFASEGAAIKSRAWTHSDSMNFHMLSPAESVPLALEILCQSYACQEFRPDEVEREKQVIVGEHLDKMSSATIQLLFTNLLPSLFADHPLSVHRETEENIRAVTPAHLSSVKQLLGARNASLALVGDIDYDQIDALVNQTFGSIAPGNLELRTLPHPSRTRHEEQYERPELQSANIIIGFPVPGISHEDEYSLDFLSTLLGKQNYQFSSRLYQEIRQKRGLAYAANASYLRLNGTGIFTVEVAGLSRGNVSSAREIAIEQLERLVREPIPKEEFERVRTNMRVTYYRQYWADALSVSEWLGRASLYGVPYERVEQERRISALTPEQVQETAARHFDGNYFIGEMVPKV
jgi:predicted Zn-dependent peptidase